MGVVQFSFFNIKPKTASHCAMQCKFSPPFAVSCNYSIL